MQGRNTELDEKEGVRRSSAKSVKDTGAVTSFPIVLRSGGKGIFPSALTELVDFQITRELMS